MKDHPWMRRHPATSDCYVYSDEELEFLRAIDRFKRKHHRPFPTWCEVLHLLKSIGYRKTESSEDP